MGTHKILRVPSLSVDSIMMGFHPSKSFRHRSKKQGNRRGAFNQSWGMPDERIKPVRVPEAQGKAILKVKTLEDSLRSIAPKEPERHSLGKRISLKVNNVLGTIKESLTGLEVKETSQEDTRSTELSVMTKGVHFSDLQIRVYDVHIDDNPSVKIGPAVALGWKFEQREPIDLETYEATRGPRRRIVVMGVVERKRLLQESGASEEEIREFTERIQDARERRRETVQRMGQQRKEERKERTKKTFQRAFRLRPSYEHEVDKLWDQAQNNEGKDVRS